MAKTTEKLDCGCILEYKEHDTYDRAVTREIHETTCKIWRKLHPRALTVAQYLAAMRRVKGCPADMGHQLNAWPYPQAQQSYLALWCESWPHVACRMPDRTLCISVVGTDCPGALIRIRDGGLTPAEAVARLNRTTKELGS